MGKTNTCKLWNNRIFKIKALVLLGIIILFTSLSYSQVEREKYFKDDSLRLLKDYYDDEMNINSTYADSNLTVVGEWPWGMCFAVAVRDSPAYRTSRSAGKYALIGNGKLIHVMDISDPSNPTVAAEYNTGGLVRDIKLRDTLAFVCTRGGLQILNISDLFFPQQISYLQLRGARQVIPTDSFAYVLENPGYNPLVKVIDITNLTNPFIRSSAPTVADFVVKIAVKDRYIYATGYNLPILTIIDARNPDRIVYADENPQIGSSAIFIRDTLMFLGAGGSSILIYSISNPTSPVFLDTAISGVYGFVRTLFVEGNYAFASNDSGLFVFDVSNPYDVYLIKRFILPGARYKLWHNNFLHMATRTGYNIINVANIDSMYEVGKFYTGGRPYDIKIQGHYAYMATVQPGLTILDVTNPISPVRIGVLPLDRETWLIVVAGSIAYLVADSAVYIVDISNPNIPSLIGTIRADTFYVGYIYVADNRLYVIHPSIQTLVYDVSDPVNPSYLGSYPLAGRELIVRDGIAYHANGTGGFVIMNVSDPKNIFELSRYYPCYAKAIVVNDSLAYIGSPYELYIFNISDPAQPESLSYIQTPTDDFYTDLSFSYPYIYISSFNLVTVNIYNPHIPTVVGQFSDILGNEIAAYQKYIFMCYPMIGIKVFRNELITSIKDNPLFSIKNMLFQNYPNPFNVSTKINFKIKEIGLTTVKIYNIMGQELTTIFEEYTMPGDYTINWDAGNLPSGVYLYQLKTKSSYEIKRGMLIK